MSKEKFKVHFLYSKTPELSIGDVIILKDRYDANAEYDVFKIFGFATIDEKRNYHLIIAKPINDLQKFVVIDPKKDGYAFVTKNVSLDEEVFPRICKCKHKFQENDLELENVNEIF